MAKVQIEDLAKILARPGYGTISYEREPEAQEPTAAQQVIANNEKDKRQNLEHQMQAEFIAWCNANAWQWWQLDWIFAVPNGGKRHPAVAKMLKAEGVRPGVPDLLCLIPSYPYNFLGIEAKIPDNEPSDQQGRWHKFLTKQGGKIVVAYSVEEMKQAAIDYFGLDICRRFQAT